jgi:putative transposase
MPSKNAVKMYIENGHYHVYNRGVEKRTIFQDEQDYAVFLGYLKEYLQPRDEKSHLLSLSAEGLSSRDKDKILKSIRLNNFDNKITLLAYCLMPNHFHLFLRQKDSSSLDRFMRSLCTRYVIYFNRKYERVGSLFQSVYKASLIDDDGYYVHISRYIHKQAIDAALVEGGKEQPSSYLEYLGARKTSWVHPEEVLSIFSEAHPLLNYEEYVLEYLPQESEESQHFDE